MSDDDGAVVDEEPPLLRPRPLTCGAAPVWAAVVEEEGGSGSATHLRVFGVLRVRWSVAQTANDIQPRGRAWQELAVYIRQHGNIKAVLQYIAEGVYVLPEPTVAHGAPSAQAPLELFSAWLLQRFGQTFFRPHQGAPIALLDLIPKHASLGGHVWRAALCGPDMQWVVNGVDTSWCIPLHFGHTWACVDLCHASYGNLLSARALCIHKPSRRTALELRSACLAAPAFDIVDDGTAEAEPAAAAFQPRSSTARPWAGCVQRTHDVWFLVDCIDFSVYLRRVEELAEATEACFTMTFGLEAKRIWKRHTARHLTLPSRARLGLGRVQLDASCMLYYR